MNTNTLGGHRHGDRGVDGNVSLTMSQSSKVVVVAAAALVVVAAVAVISWAW